MPEFSTSAELPCAGNQLLAFLRRPANLPKISDPDLELEIISAPDVVATGDVITFRITALGFKQRATHRYVETTDASIVEEQTDGPMKAWKHSQTIESLGPERCRLTDVVQFERPGGMLGFVLTEARVRESLEQGMACRYDALRDLIAAGELS